MASSTPAGCLLPRTSKEKKKETPCRRGPDRDLRDAGSESVRVTARPRETLAGQSSSAVLEWWEGLVGCIRVGAVRTSAVDSDRPAS